MLDTTPQDRSSFIMLGHGVSYSKGIPNPFLCSALKHIRGKDCHADSNGPSNITAGISDNLGTTSGLILLKSWLFLRLIIADGTSNRQ